MTVADLKRWLDELPPEMQDAEIQSIVHGQPYGAKRAVAYQWRDGSGKGVAINSMGTHISDDTWNSLNPVSILSA